MKVLVLLIATAVALAAQVSPEASRFERLAALGKLWTYVKYMHPRATAVDWDQAIVRAIPRVNAAKTDQEFLDAAEAMLAELNDPATFVVGKQPARPVSPSPAAPSARRTEDGILVLTVESSPSRDAPAQLAKLLRFDNVQAAVIDLRESKLAPNSFPPSWPVTKAVSGPRRASRRHDGYAPPPERSGGSVGYSSSWDVGESPDVPASDRQVPAVFLVRSGSRLPWLALSLQNAGVAAIVSEDPIDDRVVGAAAPFPLPGGRSSFIRTMEILHADGTMGVAANRVLNVSGEPALDAAIELARAGRWEAPVRPQRSLPSAGYLEKRYADQLYPPTELRLVAGFRIWGVFHYFFPYKHLIGEDWDQVLLEMLPKLETAGGAREYHLTVAEMVARTNDSHCSVSSPELSDFFGYRGGVPVQIRWIEDQPVVTRVLNTAAAAGVAVGDVVLSVDGQPPAQRMEELGRYLAASTPQSKINRLMGLLLSGPPGSTVALTVRGAGGPREIKLTRSSESMMAASKQSDMTPYRLINERIGYINLMLIEVGQVGEMFDQFRDTAGIVMDMRGYPRGTAWSIAPRLSARESPVAAQFRRNIVQPSGSVSSQYYFEQRLPPTTGWRYQGETVMLIDERAISQSEHSGLFYKTANGTVFVGSATAGANGDVTSCWVPGGISINFSGHDVRWADGKQLQRVGLTPDIPVKPTIAGIRAGRDEVLEKAIEYLSRSPGKPE